MDNTTLDSSQTELPLEPERPEFLKVLCILSFISCGLLILLYSFGTICLTFTEETVASFWDKFVEGYPALQNVDAMEFFHKFGMMCVYSLIATIFSLIGVIMMWRLEKIGFFMYAAAELITNFFNINVEGMEEKSTGGIIFFVIIDLVFIVMYAVNLKYMHKRNNNMFIQGGG